MLSRKNTKKSEHSTSLGYIKDALITQVQPMYGTEIVDCDIEGLNADVIKVTYYLKKGGSKKK